MPTSSKHGAGTVYTQEVAQMAAALADEIVAINPVRIGTFGSSNQNRIRED